MLIPLVALAIDRLLFWVQRQLFPYQYGGDGLLHRGVRAMPGVGGRARPSFASRRKLALDSCRGRGDRRPPRSRDAEERKPS